MHRVLVTAALLVLVAAVVSGQSPGVLHIRMTLTDSTGASIPVARHALLISDNPGTGAPRRVVTATDGHVDVRLRPGNYTVESEDPVAFGGKSYEWLHTLDVPAGADVVLELTSSNATIGTATAAAATASTTGPSTLELTAQWSDSVVALWTPTTRASGFIVDGGGLVVTSQRALGNATAATAVEVQLTPQVKVGGRVLVSDAARDVAVIWIDPSSLGSARPVPLECGNARRPPLMEGQRLAAIQLPMRGAKDVADGDVIRVAPSGSVADFRLSSGGFGGPVFGAGGATIGLSSTVDEQHDQRRRDVRIVPAEAVCGAVAEAKTSMESGQRPSGARLPVEPVQPLSLDALDGLLRKRSGQFPPYQVSAADFDVSLLTPMAIRAAEVMAREGRTSSRSLNAPAKGIDPTDFGGWSDYFAETPPVLLVRVTPKLEEGLWARIARGAAYTQGVALPPIRRFAPGFASLRVFCGDVEVTPIHPFILEQRISDNDGIREGLYVYDAAALGSHCAPMTLRLASEKAPGKEDTRAVDRRIVEQMSNDLAAYRAVASSAGASTP